MEFKTKYAIELEDKIENFREFLSYVVDRLKVIWRNSSGEPWENEEMRIHGLACIILNIFNMRFPKPTTNGQIELSKDEHQNNT